MRVRRRVILQHDTQVIGVSRLLSGSSLPEFNGCPCGGRRRGGSGQIAGDLMDLRRCEAVRFLFLASNEGYGEQERHPPQRTTRQVDTGTNNQKHAACSKSATPTGELASATYQSIHTCDLRPA